MLNNKGMCNIAQTRGHCSRDTAGLTEVGILLSHRYLETEGCWLPDSYPMVPVPFWPKFRTWYQMTLRPITGYQIGI